MVLIAKLMPKPDESSILEFAAKGELALLKIADFFRTTGDCFASFTLGEVRFA